MQPTRRATLQVLLAGCCFGSIAILVVLGKQGGATLLTLLTWRYLLGCLGLVVASGGPRAAQVARARIAPLLVLGGGGQTAVTLTSLSALDYIPAGTLGFLFYTYPAWITVIAAVRGTERLTAPRALALVLSLAGILLMVGNPFASTLHPVGVGLALASALIYALYVPLIDRLGTGLAPTTTSAWVTGGAALILGTIALARGQLDLTPSPSAWGVIAVMALVSTVLAFTAFLRGLAVLGPVRTGIVSTIEPFWTALLGAVLLDQPLTGGVVAGGACIAGAVALLQWRPGAGTRS